MHGISNLKIFLYFTTSTIVADLPSAVRWLHTALVLRIKNFFFFLVFFSLGQQVSDINARATVLDSDYYILLTRHKFTR